MSKELTAIIESEGHDYVALCPEVNVASQGETVTEARANLQEALELFFETTSETEIEQRDRSEVYVTKQLAKIRVHPASSVCRILEAHDFVEVRRRGSHIVMQRVVGPITRTVPVPRRCHRTR